MLYRFLVAALLLATAGILIFLGSNSFDLTVGYMDAIVGGFWFALAISDLVS